jgi:hypothetical protein
LDLLSSREPRIMMVIVNVNVNVQIGGITYLPCGGIADPICWGGCVDEEINSHAKRKWAVASAWVGRLAVQLSLLYLVKHWPLICSIFDLQVNIAGSVNWGRSFIVFLFFNPL